MSTRPTLGLIYLVQGLQRLGEDPEPVLQRHGLSAATLDPASRIERTRELRLYADLADTLRDPLVGLKLGDSYGLAGYGPLVMLLMTCATVWEGLQMGVRYQRLTYLFGQLRLQPGERESALVLDPATLSVSGPSYRFRVDGEVSGTFKMMRDMQMAMGLTLRPARVDLPYPRPAEAAAYEQHYGCPVCFGQSEARLWIDNAVLHTPHPTADGQAHALYRTLCDQQLAAQDAESHEGLADRVRHHLGLFTGDWPDADAVARAFGLSERSLRRQLAAQGQNFRDLLADVRYRRARGLLKQTRQPIEAIAQQLGYAESAAFIHAFRRWSGLSPTRWREQPPDAEPGSPEAAG